MFQIRKEKKNIKFRIENLLKLWNTYWIMRKSGILIFCQKLSLNAIKDLKINLFFNDKQDLFKTLNKNILIKYFNKKFYYVIKNYNNILIIKNLKEIKNIEKFFKDNEILILGYYMNNIFFYKKDLNIRNIEKKEIYIYIKKI